MTDQGPAKTAGASTPEVAPPSTPAAEDAPAPTPTTTADVVDITADDGAWTTTSARSTTKLPPIRAFKRVAKRKPTPAEAEKAKKGKKKLVRSVGLPASLPVEASTPKDVSSGHDGDPASRHVSAT
ncbi:hypothetical protein PR001_g22217 [Phytophthora rubi]|uniref:Uncharacterized protein n=1 Tax=Phytophthora rubi TaxID=129364 RepID=A0A6A3HEB0_9STRA|nr:hypothetical protein PR002_g28119 [Phytophthora rubi]KAE8987815.1 hypothetical protein PR001_g22217 [Phytophthora rubi]